MTIKEIQKIKQEMMEAMKDDVIRFRYTKKDGSDSGIREATLKELKVDGTGFPVPEENLLYFQLSENGDATKRGWRSFKVANLV